MGHLGRGVLEHAEKMIKNGLRLRARLFEKQILTVVSKIIHSGTFLEGRENKKLVKMLEKYFGSGKIVLTASGHDAIFLSLKSLKLGPKDEVIFPVNSYPTAHPIFLSGAQPVGCDVDENGQLDPKQVLKKINKNTKVIFVVHLYGLVGKLDKLLRIAKEKELILLEDCAQAFGAKFDKRLIGTFGSVSCFSFYPTKNLATLGDGGAVWTKNLKFYNYLKKAKMYGEERRYQGEFISGHSRIPEIQAGILNVYLEILEKELTKRIKLANYYRLLLNNPKVKKHVRVLSSHPLSEPAQHQFVVAVEKRDKLVSYLNKYQIKTAIHYPYSVNRVKAFKNAFPPNVRFAIAEKLSNTILSLPFNAYMTEEEIDYIVDKMIRFYTHA